MWNGFEIKEFDFEGKTARIVFPKDGTEDKEKNWMFKTEYWNAFPAIEIALLNKGFHLVNIENESRFATKEDCDRKARLADYVSKEYGLSKQCVTVGYSLGGAHAVNFAGFYPDYVKCIYLDAPVLNFCDYPGRLQFEECENVWETEFLKAYPGMTRAKLFNFENHPMNKLDILKEHKIPIIMLYGTEDKTVNYCNNGAVMELEYEDCPELLTVIPRVMQGHHPHGCLLDNSKLIDFVWNKTHK